MKNLRQIIIHTKELILTESKDLNNTLWQLICYAPKMPLRLQQEQLLAEANKITLKVYDDYFAHKELNFNVFKWGDGKRKILITHGWGSKAADFSEMIILLKQINDVQVIAFDAPGNGSSEGDLSNLLLFILAVKAINNLYGIPDIVIGHSLGAMANVMALQELSINPALLISLTPLVRLKENFESSMNAVNVPAPGQTAFLQSFERLFNKPAEYFNLVERYAFSPALNHWLAYDVNDNTSPYEYLNDFLKKNSSIKTKNYEGVGHERILKSPEVISDLLKEVKNALLIS
jgi:pimeloyl-ACP methyl ester carboxylesterase